MNKCVALTLLPLGLLLARPAVADSPPAADDMNKQLADTQDRLSTALHSFSLLQEENSQLKDAADKAAADKDAVQAQLDQAETTIAALKVQAATATQVGTLRTQVRQLQDEIGALAAENERLKLRLALLSPRPPGTLAEPTRPAQ